MKQTLLLVAIGIFLVCCGSSENQNKQDTISDSTKSTSTQTVWGGSAIIPTTHLQDTIEIDGNMILFLRPDFARLESYVKQDSTVKELDTDFGTGISGTFENLTKNAKYENLKMEISICRYVKIRDCKGGPVVLDRDSVNFGYVLTQTGKDFITSNEVHSDDYTTEIDEYFKTGSTK